MPRTGTSAKRAPNGNGNIRKKTVTKNGSKYSYWEARYTVGFDTGTGKQIQRSVTGKTQKEVAQKLKEITLEIDNGAYIEPSKITLGKWLDIWLKEYTTDKKYQTVNTYAYSINNHIKPKLGAVKLSQLTAPIIQMFYNELLRSGKQVAVRDKSGKIVKKNGKTVFENEPLNAKTVRNTHGVLTKALATAVEVGYLKDNPAEKTTLPRVKKKNINPLSDKQVAEFIKLVDKDPFGVIYKVILFTGLRESEALGLTWDCVDFKHSKIRINKQLQRRRKEDGGVVLASTKNDKERTITVTPYVLDLLHTQKIQQANQSLLIGKAWKAWKNHSEYTHALVFTMPDGDSITQSALRHHFDRLRVELGRPDCRIHDLRHTFAVLSLQNGDDIKTLQENLGHATAAFTLDVYGHVSEKMRTESANRMQKYIDGLAE